MSSRTNGGKRAVCKLLFDLAKANHSFDYIAERLGVDKAKLAYWFADDRELKNAFRNGREAFCLGLSKAVNKEMNHA